MHLNPRNHSAWLGAVALSLAAGAPFASLRAAAPAAPAAPAAGSAAGVALLLPGATLVPGASARVNVVSRAEEQVVLLALYLVTGKSSRILLNDSIPTYSLKPMASTLVPLGELCRQFQFAVEVTPLEGRAAGWFTKESRTFKFDAKTGVAVVNGREQLVDPRRYEVHDTEIFVDMTLFTEWFNVTFKVNTLDAILEAASPERLPIEDWRLRTFEADKKSAQGVQDFAVEQKKYRPQDVPFTWVDMPYVDQTLQITHSAPKGSPSSWQAASTTLTAGDLLGLEQRSYFSIQGGNGGQHRDFRMTIGRRDPEGSLPLGATQILAGDVMGQGLDLISSASPGAGFLISNAPLFQPALFDRRSFRGSLPPGWQVELYHNAALVGMQNVRPDGTYEYLDVPLIFGPNEYKLVFYGPQGQRREEIYRSDINPTQLPKGEFRYQFLTQRPEHREDRVVANVEYGLTRNLSIGTGFASLGLETRTPEGVAPERRSFSNVQMRAFTDFLAAQMTVATMDGGKKAGDLALQTGYGNTRLSLRHTALEEGYHSDVLMSDATGLRGLSQADATFFLTPSWMNAFSITLGGTHATFRDDRITDGLSARFSTSIRGLMLSNSLQRALTRRADGTESVTNSGEFMLSRAMRGWSLRGQASYGLGPDSRVQRISGFADIYLPQSSFLMLGVTRDQLTRENLASATFYRQSGLVGIGADASYGARSGFRASLNLRAGFGREPRKGTWTVDARNSQTNGGASVVAFLDLNNNGVRDSGEPGVEHVGFLVNGSQHPARTDKDGVAFLPDLQAGLNAFIRVATGTLEDPALHSQHPGVRIPVRAGKVARIELPLIARGELDGTVFGITDGQKRPAAGLLVELVNTKDEVVQQIRSAYDGYFLMTGLMPGTYTLRLNPQDSQKRNHKPQAGRTIVIAATGSQLDGQNLDALWTPPAAPATVPVVDPGAILERATAPREKSPQQAQAMATDGWALRLMVVTQSQAVERCLAQLHGVKGTPVVVPLKGREGKQILLTGFTSKAEAETALASLPRAFRAPGNRPFVFLAAHTATPAQQARL